MIIIIPVSVENTVYNHRPSSLVFLDSVQSILHKRGVFYQRPTVKNMNTGVVVLKDTIHNSGVCSGSHRQTTPGVHHCQTFYIGISFNIYPPPDTVFPACRLKDYLWAGDNQRALDEQAVIIAYTGTSFNYDFRSGQDVQGYILR